MKTPATFNSKAGPNDTDEMREAIEALNADGVRFSRPTQYQLKIGDLSFYPGTGSIFRDGEGKGWEQHGLGALISHLREKRKPTGKIIDFASDDHTIPPSAIALNDIPGAGATISGAGPTPHSNKRIFSLVPKKRPPR